MEEVRDWLPRTAFPDRGVLACARGIVASWCTSWFAGRIATVAFAAGTGNGSAAGDDLPLSFHGKIADAVLTDDGVALLFEAAVGSGLPKKPTAEDRNVMQLFAERVTSDLMGRFEDAFGPRAPSSGERVVFSVSLVAHGQAQAAFVLNVPRHAFAALLKQQCGRSAPQGNVGTLRDALAPIPMRLEALLGCARLSMGDVRAMAPGDVLVLDRELEDRVEIVIADSNASIGRGKFRFDGEHATVEL